MYEIICPLCGRSCYSATRLDWLKNKTCPYCGYPLIENEQDKTPADSVNDG
ncbi:MAG: hypothetical protein GX425_02655 [Peptococcaceae bacterium]|nr:hypothetical protein [Peptococcaceae bacterium]